MASIPDPEPAGADTVGTGDSSTLYLAVPIFLLLITAFFVAVRLLSNYNSTGKFLFDDYVAAAAIILTSATFALSDVGLRQYAEMESSSPDPSTLTPTTVSERNVALFALSVVSTITSKAPILFLYVRLFGSERWLKVCSYCTLLALSALVVTAVVAVGVVCHPHGVAPSMDTCIVWWDEAWMACGAVSLAADVAILLIPIPIISKLRLPVRKRLGLALVFASGVFAIAATTIALWYKIKSLNGESSNWNVGMLWSVIEWCIAIIVGCVPPVYTFWSTVITRSALYTKVTQTLSDIGSSFTKPHTHSRTTREGDSSSTRHITDPDPTIDGVSIQMSRTNSDSRL